MTSRTYAGVPLPASATAIGARLSQKYIGIINDNYDEVSASTEDYPTAEILIPKKKFEWRFVPGTLEFLDEEDGFNDEIKIDKFINGLNFDEFFCWNSFGLSDFDILFSSPYSTEVRRWMTNARFKDNLGMSSRAGEFSVVSNIFFGFNVFSGTSDIIKELDAVWGDRNLLALHFRRYVNDYVQNSKQKRWLEEVILPLAET